MSGIKALWKDGRIIPVEAVTWPDGSLLRVEPDAEEQVVDADNQADDPQSVARWIAEFDAIPPLEMTQEEEAAWRQARLAQRLLESYTVHGRADSLRSIIE